LERERGTNSGTLALARTPGPVPLLCFGKSADHPLSRRPQPARDTPNPNAFPALSLMIVPASHSLIFRIAAG
jgi:hypothetical protein